MYNFPGNIAVNKKLLMSALASAMALAAFAPTSVLATDGTIHITGEVTASTCTVSTSGGNIDVALPSVSTNALTSNGDVAGRTAFTIDLTGCTATGAQTFFEPGTFTNSNGNLDIQGGTGSASNVQVQLLNDDLSPIDVSAPQGSQNSHTVTFPTGATDASLSYFAQYYSLGTAGAGTVDTSVTFSVVYQ